MFKHSLAAALFELRKAKPPCDIPIRGLMERASKRHTCKRSRSSRSFWLLCSRLHSSFGRDGVHHVREHLDSAG
jgi:hypothetical protein